MEREQILSPFGGGGRVRYFKSGIYVIPYNKIYAIIYLNT
jgi:hypothetical protein